MVFPYFLTLIFPDRLAIFLKRNDEKV